MSKIKKGITPNPADIFFSRRVLYEQHHENKFEDGTDGMEQFLKNLYNLPKLTHKKWEI